MVTKIRGFGQRFYLMDAPADIHELPPSCENAVRCKAGHLFAWRGTEDLRPAECPQCVLDRKTNEMMHLKDPS